MSRSFRPTTFFALTLSLATVPTHAITLSVTKTADTADGSCDADCSLREAILTANATGGSNTVVVPSGAYILTMTGAGEEAAATGDLDLTGGLTITGAGAATTAIDGNRTDRVFQVHTGATVSISGVAIRNGALPGGNGGGIRNDGTLTLTAVFLHHNVVTNDSVFQPGIRSGDGGAIFNTGTLSLEAVAVFRNNTTRTTFGNNSGAIFNAETGTFVLNNSSMTANGNINTCNGSAVLNMGMFVANNSTISGNLATSIYCAGPAVLNNGPTATTALNNTTISDNVPVGIFRGGGTITIQNTLIARNGTTGTSDCKDSLSLHSLGHNLIGAASCTVDVAPGDQIGTPDSPIDAKLGRLIASGGYQPLLAESTAIDGGNPAGCMGSAGALTADQRGVARVGRCDIGAYEFKVPGAAAAVVANDGAPQHAGPLTPFARAIQAAVLDGAGSPVGGVVVTFTAPGGGASSTFANTATVTTALTDDSGVASATLTANAALGNYDVLATVNGIAAPAMFPLTNLVWYVTANGVDAGNCLSPGTACTSPDRVLAESDFVPGDTILLAAGTYTGTGPDQVFLIDQDVKLSGGWTDGFTSQKSSSVVDGQNARGGITVAPGPAVLIRGFTVRNGSRRRGGGINVGGTLTLEDSTIAGNADNGDGGGGIANGGTLHLVRVTISGNSSSGGGGGIHNFGTLIVRNSTISGNSNTQGFSQGGGIVNSGTVLMNNTTVTANTGPGILNATGTVTSSNSIVAGNVGPAGVDCSGTLTSAGYNILGENTG